MSYCINLSTITQIVVIVDVQSKIYQCINQLIVKFDYYLAIVSRSVKSNSCQCNLIFVRKQGQMGINNIRQFIIMICLILLPNHLYLKNYETLNWSSVVLFSNKFQYFDLISNIWAILGYPWLFPATYSCLWLSLSISS